MNGLTGRLVERDPAGALCENPERLAVVGDRPLVLGTLVGRDLDARSRVEAPALGAGLHGLAVDADRAPGEQALDGRARQLQMVGQEAIQPLSGLSRGSRRSPSIRSLAQCTVSSPTNRGRSRGP